MSDSPPPSERATAAAGPRRPGRRRALWVLALGLATLVFVALGLLSARLYFHDARLRALATSMLSEQLGTEVRIDSLDLSLWRGITLQNLRIGAPEGFAEPVVHLGAVSVAWRPAALLRGTLVLSHVRVRDLSLTLEQTKNGATNVAQLLEHLGAREPPPDSAGETALAGLPVPIRVNTVDVRNVGMRLQHPDFVGRLQPVAVHGSATVGRDLNIRAQLRGTIGRRPGQGKPATLQLRRRTPELTVRAPTRLQWQLAIDGWSQVRLDLRNAMDVRVSTLPEMAALPVRGRMAAVVDLLQGQAALKSFRWRVGEAADVEATASFHGWPTSPELSVQALAGTLHLDAVAQMAQTLGLDIQTSGTLGFSAEPVVLPVYQLAAGDGPTLDIAMHGENIAVALPAHGLRAGPLDWDANLRAASKKLAIEGEGRIAAAAGFGAELHGLQFDWQVDAPLWAWLSGVPDASVAVRATVDAARVGQQNAFARDVAVQLDAQLPPQWLLGLQNAPAANLRLQAAAKHAQAAGFTAAAASTSVALQAPSRAGTAAAADIDARVEQLASPTLGRVDLAGPLTLAGRALRRGSTLTLSDWRVRAGSLASADASGELALAADSNTLSVSGEASARVPELAAVLQRLPARLRPPVQMAAAAALTLRVDGGVPLDALHELPTNLGRPGGSPTGTGVPSLQRYKSLIARWSSLLGPQWPLTLQLQTSIGLRQLETPRAALRDGTLNVAATVQPGGIVVDSTIKAARLVGPVMAEGLDGRFSGRLEDGTFDATTTLGARKLEQGRLAQSLSQVRFSAAGHYALQGDLTLRELSLTAEKGALEVSAQGLVSKPWRAVVQSAWRQPDLGGLQAEMRGAVQIRTPKTLALLDALPRVKGALRAQGRLALDDGVAEVDAQLHAEKFTLRQDALKLQNVTGQWPLSLALAFAPRPDATVLRRDVPFGGGVIAIRTAAPDIRTRPARPLYYDRLSPYRKQRGLSIQRVQLGPYAATALRLDGSIANGMLLVDQLALKVLGGDVAGRVAVQLGRDGSLRADLTASVSHIDASHFDALDLQPGPQSQLNADLNVELLLAPSRRNLSLNMNVTKVGSRTLDRFLQLLDPEGKEEKIQNVRQNLSLIDINRVSMWVRYENLNMDLDYSPELPVPGTSASVPLRIPFTDLAYRPVPRDVFRRYQLGTFLDVYLQPYVDRIVAPLLDWAA